MRDAALFHGLTDKELTTALDRLRAKEKAYPKDAFLFLAGDRTGEMGLVLTGSVTIESGDLWGNRTILSHIGPGQFFAETYALLAEPLLVDVRANEDCRVLFCDLIGMRQGAEIGERWAAKVTVNLLTISAHKNLTLSSRSFHTAPKTVRARVMAYLNSVALQKGGREFDIPFDRQQLADYLNLDRSALSKELGNMREDGLIRCRKNHFVLLP